MGKFDKYLSDTTHHTGDVYIALTKYNEAVKRAFAQPQKPVKIKPGYYLVAVGGELVVIDQPLDEGQKEWRYYEANHKWYGDPCATMTMVKHELGI